MGVPLLDLKAQYQTIREETNAAVLEVLESQYFILGPKVKALEEQIAAYTQTQHAIGVSSGTDALLISLMAEGIGPGDEVITTPYSFFATAGCVTRTGATPVFVDIDPVDFNIDPARIEAAITPKTKAIIPIHLYGQMADMDGVMQVANRHNLCVIEDGAQAIGCEFKNRRAGSIGHYGCFSFFPSKNLGGAGDGGIVVTNDPKRAETLSIMRVHGGKPKYYHRVIGGNFRLDAIQAAVLLVKLQKLDQWTEGRQKNADLYRAKLKAAGLVVDPASLDSTTLDMTGRRGVALPKEFADRRHIYNQFVLRTDRREELRAFLTERGIGNEVYYPVPFHEQDCFQYLGYKKGQFPISEVAATQSIAVPIYPELNDAQIQEVVNAIAEFHKV
ncbi:MAG: DegT/DnrJ/EryC1/StrS family aminotransferase [Calditrichaeota bacterium]|nr:DegT/DnrJ/EryC1/StrS family aminotransferase [Calditrichota bacterium]